MEPIGNLWPKPQVPFLQLARIGTAEPLLKRQDDRLRLVEGPLPFRRAGQLLKELRLVGLRQGDVPPIN